MERDPYVGNSWFWSDYVLHGLSFPFISLCCCFRHSFLTFSCIDFFPNWFWIHMSMSHQFHCFAFQFDLVSKDPDRPKLYYTHMNHMFGSCGCPLSQLIWGLLCIVYLLSRPFIDHSRTLFRNHMNCSFCTSIAVFAGEPIKLLWSRHKILGNGRFSLVRIRTPC